MSYRTPLARPPFPRVRWTRTQERALMRAIAGFPLGPYPRVLTCPGEKRVSAVAQRAVLEAVAARGNGAGFSFMRVVTIASESRAGVAHRLPGLARTRSSRTPRAILLRQISWVL